MRPANPFIWLNLVLGIEDARKVFDEASEKWSAHAEACIRCRHSHEFPDTYLAACEAGRPLFRDFRHKGKALVRLERRRTDLRWLSEWWATTDAVEGRR